MLAWLVTLWREKRKNKGSKMFSVINTKLHGDVFPSFYPTKSETWSRFKEWGKDSTLNGKSWKKDCGYRKRNNYRHFCRQLPQWHSCLCCLLEFSFPSFIGIINSFSLSNSSTFLLHKAPLNLFTVVVFFNSNSIFVLCSHTIFSL